MSNAKQFEERGDPWGRPSRFEPVEFPDEGGPIERPFNPNFRDAPKAQVQPVDWRQLHRLRTVRSYTHQTIQVERPPVPEVHHIEPIEDTPERRQMRWRKFIEQERAENAARRAAALARKESDHEAD